MRRPALLAGLVAALVLLPAPAALAHPALNPNQVPVGEPVDAVLVVPHGCSTGDSVRPEEGAEAIPTTRFDLQHVDGVTVEPAEVDGWEVADDGEAIVWTDDGGATTDVLEFPVTLTVEEGTPGDELALAAYQECEDGSSYRWTEGSDRTPAVALELTAGETGQAEMDMEDMDHGAGEMDDMSEDTDDTAGATDTATEPATEDATEAATAVEGGGLDGATVAAIVAIVVAVAAGIVSLVRRKRTA